MRQQFLFLILLGAITLSAQQEVEQPSLDSLQQLDEVIINQNVILGNKYVAENRTGSAYYLSAKELQKFNTTDIGRVLQNIPGVTVTEEDGFGLRPNISLRGTSPIRTSKITVMEDGVLIAPAPYSASAAYYFPTVARMEAVEILKGSSQIQYGPFTTGGAINLVSTQIPNTVGGKIKSTYGSFNTKQTYLKFGGGGENTIGYMVEFFNYSSDGFKDLPSDKDTGFDKIDFVAKVRARLFPNSSVKQTLDFKFQYSDEDSNDTYLGLTESDYKKTPFARYAASSNDNMSTKHTQFSLTHTADFSKNIRLTTTAYQNNFSRNWYKLNDLKFEGDESSSSIASILANPIDKADYLAVIRGDVNSSDNALNIKANDRKYLSKGIQTKFDYHFKNGNTFNDIEVGLRYHYDEEDRNQWIDQYKMDNKELVLTNANKRDANRISSANAFAAYVTYKLKYNNWTLTPGIRYENITLQRKDYGKNDVDRLGTDLTIQENKVSVFIPGMGANYKFNNNLSVFGGVHKGFSPPSSSDGQKAEQSVNYELGTRFKVAGLKGELTGFYNDYSNLLGSDVAASGGTGTLDQFNAGEVDVKGLEVSLNYNVLPNQSKFKLPLTLGYTYTNTEFLSNFDSDTWGEVAVGDELPYIPNHQFNANLGLEHRLFEFNVNTRYNGAYRTQAGVGEIPANEKVEGHLIVDLAAKYYLMKGLNITANVINLFNNTYAVSRFPAGLRPGHPFGLYGGLSYTF